MTIQILGSGCQNRKKLEESAREVVARLGGEDAGSRMLLHIESGS